MEKALFDCIAPAFGECATDVNSILEWIEISTKGVYRVNISQARMNHTESGMGNFMFARGTYSTSPEAA
jgi:hypothetical protein